MQEFIMEMMDKYGYFGIVFLIFIENVFPPIPSEVILTFGGFLTTYTKLTVMWTTLFATAGSVLGALVLYGVGKLMTPNRLDRFVEGKVGKLLRLKKENIDKARKWFDDKGNNTVFFCRFIPIVRSMISIPAGMAEMHLVPFIILTTLGSFAWNLVLVSFGAFAGSSWNQAAAAFTKYADVVKIALIMVIVIFVLKKVLDKLAAKKSAKKF